jgi:hypothetical protein
VGRSRETNLGLDLEGIDVRGTEPRNRDVREDRADKQDQERDRATMHGRLMDLDQLLGCRTERHAPGQLR